MALQSKASILTASKKRIKSIRVDEFEDEIYIRQLSGGERVELARMFKEAQSASPDDAFKTQCSLIAMIVTDENGDPVFTRSDIDAIAGISAKAIDQIAAEGLRFSGLWSGAVDEASKNSNPSPS